MRERLAQLQALRAALDARYAFDLAMLELIRAVGDESRSDPLDDPDTAAYIHEYVRDESKRADRVVGVKQLDEMLGYVGLA